MAVGQQFSTSFTATSGNTSVSIGFRPTYVKVINDAATSITAYVSFVSSAATTALTDWPIIGGSTQEIRVDKLSVAAGMSSAIGIICATGSSAAVRVFALKL